MVKEIMVRTFNILLCVLLAVILGASMFITPKYSTTSASATARIENSATLSNLPVSQADTWSGHTWGGSSNQIYGNNVWSDGTNYYFSMGTVQLVLDTSTNTWSTMTWSGLTNFEGRFVWTDGTNYYYSNGTNQYVLDISTNTWSTMTWSGLTNFVGFEVWSGNSTVFYSSSSRGTYVLDISTNTWSLHNFSRYPYGALYFGGNDVWTDGTNYYVSNGTDSTRTLDLSNFSWGGSSLTGLTTFLGQYVWSFNGSVYYSYGSNQYVLDTSTGVWSTMTWSTPNNASFDGFFVWSVGDVAYYSNYVNYTNYQWYYNVSSSTPTTITLPRLDFEYPQNKLVHSNYAGSDYYIDFVSLQPLIQNDTLSFTTDSFIDFRYGTSGQRAREFVSIEFLVGQSAVGSIALTSLSTVTDLQFSHYRGDFNISAFTVGSFSGTQLISFGSTMNNVTNFQPANLNISVTDLPTSTYPYGAKRNNIMYSDSNGNMVVMYIYYIEGTAINSSNWFVSNLYIPESSYSLVDTGSGDYSAGYSAGYDTGFNAGESSGYDDGYNVGYSSGDSAGYNRGYSAGDSAGYTRGYGVGETVGYNTGYTAGTQDANSYTFLALVSATIDAPIQAFMGLFNFYVFGVHISDFILGLITLSVALIILRVALKGGK